jgi:hypothetical protein
MKNWIVILCLLAGCRTAPQRDVQPAAAPPVVVGHAEVVAAVTKLDSQALWPRFDVRAIPVLLFDGKQSWLYGHPYPPEEFRQVSEGVFVHEGRHPTVTANSTTKIEGLLTATLLPMGDALSLPERVGLVVHEQFHAFQQKNHPLWSANEAELFVYPLDDAQNIAGARLEAEALRRALAATGDASTCWAAAAMAERRARFVKLPASAASYEWGMELNEGLPTYVQHRAAQTPDERVLPPFDAASVRQRAYGTGHAIARLLDRVAPQWRERMERGEAQTLDQLLTVAIANAPSNCNFTDAERAEAQQLATADAAAIRASRATRRAEFLARAGWRVVVTMKSSVLWPQRFDPLNVHLVALGEILHTRHVKLGNEQSHIEILDHPALTAAAGAHPLFNGVKRVTVTGLGEKPVIEEKDGIITITAKPLTARLIAADVEVEP